jgi:hypothetical protein
VTFWLLASDFPGPEGASRAAQRRRTGVHRYSRRNENFVRVRSKEPEAGRKAESWMFFILFFLLLASGFWLLASISRCFLAGYQGRSPWLVRIENKNALDCKDLGDPFEPV